jgi:hypothetical protein
MSIPKPRQGDNLGFQIYPASTTETTLGDPEKIIWSSIRQLCAREIMQYFLLQKYGIKKRSIRSTIANSVKLYIEQASEFYEAAQLSKPNTAPLFYYYSFLNLAKARCEIYRPRFHETNECYRHGLSWKPDPSWVVNMKREAVSVSTRGVWHVLLEAVTGKQCTMPNPARLRVGNLFSYCSDTAVEYERTYGGDLNLVDLIDPSILATKNKKDIWIKFSVRRNDLRTLHVTKKNFLDLFTLPHRSYREVKADDKELVSFELFKPNKLDRRKPYFDCVREEISKMNIFATLAYGGMRYAVPLQSHLPVVLPQIVVLYTLMFWLSSLVRYDPHSLAVLRDSGYWLLIDGFMRQSQIRLLELFHWEFYQLEVSLSSMR